MTLGQRILISILHLIYAPKIGLFSMLSLRTHNGTPGTLRAI
jgi:hypothetical protein